MALYHRWDVKNDFSSVLQFFSLIFDGPGSVPDFNNQYQLTNRICKISEDIKAGIFRNEDGSWKPSVGAIVRHFGEKRKSKRKEFNLNPKRKPGNKNNFVKVKSQQIRYRHESCF